MCICYVCLYPVSGLCIKVLLSCISVLYLSLIHISCELVILNNSLLSLMPCMPVLETVLRNCLALQESNQLIIWSVQTSNSWRLSSECCYFIFSYAIYILFKIVTEKSETMLKQNATLQSQPTFPYCMTLYMLLTEL